MAAPNEPDTDIAAVQTIVSALRPLEPADRERVLAAVSALLGTVPAARAAGIAAQEQPAAALTEAALTGIVDIRSLKETKQPRSANEMAAIAAYYLANLAPSGDRRETVGSADMERLFKQGGYPLPRKLNMLLPNATASGYFDQAGRAQYRLNPVGHNLVVHALPAGGTGSPRAQRTGRTSAKRAAAPGKRRPITPTRKSPKRRA
jgi:hypothetical protein